MLPYFKLFSLLIVCFFNLLSLGSKHLLEKATCLSHSKVIPQPLFLRAGMHEAKTNCRTGVFKGTYLPLLKRKERFPLNIAIM